MPSYALLWQEQGAESIHLGRAELDAHGLALHGGPREAPVRHYIRDQDLSEVSREPVSRIGPLKAFRVITRDGLSLLAAPMGIAMFCELFEQVALLATQLN